MHEVEVVVTDSVNVLLFVYTPGVTLLISMFDVLYLVCLCGVDLDEVDAEEGGYTRYTYNGKGWEVVYKIPVYTRGYHITYLQVYIV